MKTLTVKTKYSEYKNVFVRLGSYIANDSIAIELWNNKEGMIARITVCIPNSTIKEDEVIINTDSHPWAMEFIKEHGLGIEIEKMIKSVYGIYPVVKLNLKEISKYLEVV